MSKYFGIRTELVYKIGVLSAFFLTYFLIFFSPKSVEQFSLVYDLFFRGEIWRIFTYSFVHLNLSHLLANVVGLSILILLIYEFNMNFQLSVRIYLLAGIFAAIPIWFVTKLSVLGASTAIYAGYGFVCYLLPKYGIRERYAFLGFFLLTIIPIMMTYVVRGVGDAFFMQFFQALLHLSGLLFGVWTYLLYIHFHPVISSKKYSCLRVISDG